MGDVASMRICEDESMADVMLKNTDNQLPTLRTVTSGCGGGSTFRNKGQRVDSDVVRDAGGGLSLMKELQERMELYRLSGGVHTAALSDGKDLLVVTEDIGRHNTLDKIQGECLLRGVPTKDRSAADHRSRFVGDAAQSGEDAGPGRRVAPLAHGAGHLAGP